MFIYYAIVEFSVLFIDITAFCEEIMIMYASRLVFINFFQEKIFKLEKRVARIELLFSMRHTYINKIKGSNFNKMVANY
jgi:hypothetical protein